MSEAEIPSAEAPSTVKKKRLFSDDYRRRKAEYDLIYRRKRSAHIAEYKKQWHVEHREEVNARSSANYAANRDSIAAARKVDYYATPKEQRQQAARDHYLSHKLAVDERARKYAIENREKVLASKRLHYANNKLRISAYDKQRSSTPEARERAKKRARAWMAVPGNAERAREKARQRRLSNREAANAKMRAYGKTAKGRLSKANIKHNRRTAEKAGDVTLGQLAEVKRAAKGRCYYCREKRKLTIDHIVPFARGGTHTRQNIAMACGKCNSSKGAKDPHEWAKSRGLLLV